MGKLFGTDGVRGIANRQLTPELAFRLGKAGAYILGNGEKKIKIVIGKDTRISGDMLESALTAGICSMGADVLKVGILPTPGIAFLTRELEASAGVVISASHNPAKDNGIKFFAGTGYKLADEIENQIEEILDRLDELEVPSGDAVGKVVDVENALELYGDFLAKTSSTLDGIKIVLDCANGAAFQVGPRVLESLGAQVIPIFDQPDGKNINVGCGSTHPEQLVKEVLEHGADIGLACDGDADRMIAVDEKGEIVDGDRIMVICALALKEKGKLPGSAVTVTVMSNIGLHKALQENGIKIYETKVGDRYVMETLLKTDSSLGGEQSGHIIFLEHNTTGDGLLSALQLLSVMKEKGRKLSELASQMKRYPQVLLNTRITKKEEVLQDKEVQAKIGAVQKLLGSNGRILVRPSGTEPLIRVMVEGPDETELNKLAQEVIMVIEQADKKYKV